MVKNWQFILSHMKSVLMSRGRSSHDAEDLVQEAFVKLACYERDNVVEKPEAFLMRAALNLSLDAYRARKKHGEEVLLEDATLVDPAPAIEDVLLGRERVELLSKSLATLEPKTCSIFLAHRVEGMSYAEIAREHRITVSAVEKQIAKAMIVIMQVVEGWWP